MSNNKRVQSVEPNIADLVNGWLKKYGLDYKLKQEKLNDEIDKALNEYASKSGGKGGNIPDVKLLLQDENLNYYPIIIECKGYKDKLVKLDSNGQIDNKDNKNEPNYNHIKSYAVNGAVHYASAILNYTSYTDVIAIGVTGYKNANGNLKHSIGVYYVSKDNFGYLEKKVGEYTDLSFLREENFNDFIKKAKILSLKREERENLKERTEKEITTSLKSLNDYIFDGENGISEEVRLYLIIAIILSTLGFESDDKKVKPLTPDELTSKDSINDKDGNIIYRRVEDFLNAKNIRKDNKEKMLHKLRGILDDPNINRIPIEDENQNKTQNKIQPESQLKRIFLKTVDILKPYYKNCNNGKISIDFAGMLFNEIYKWIGFAENKGKKGNNVVFTPPYVATLLVKLAKVNKNSRVLDLTAGSGGLLIAAMNEMLIDVNDYNEINRIKKEELFGAEILDDIHLLAVFNMILMGDGNTNIYNCDGLNFEKSLKKYFKDGYALFSKKKPTAVVLNPPYSLPETGKGMKFLKEALSMMQSGYASIIIQNSAGSGQAVEYNKKILKNNTLLASIKMPKKLFIGKSTAKTYIYVFKVGYPHKKDNNVKFIDFSNDGYERNARNNSNNNLINKNSAKERYQEIVELVHNCKSKPKFLTEKEYYVGKIDPENGADWNQSAPIIETIPKLEDFKKTVSDYLAWEVSNILKGQNEDNDSLGK